MFKIKLRRFIGVNLYPLVRFYIFLSFKFKNFNKKPPIIILTAGKVGSSSVYYTLKKYFVNNYVFHIHTLDNNRIEKAISVRIKDKRAVSKHLLVSQFLIKKLSNFEGEVKIITLSREPISRGISSFFQNIDAYSHLQKSNLEIDKLRSVPIIKKDVLASIKWLGDWFDNEIYGRFNINLLKEDLSSLPYKVFINENIKLLFIKMELLNKEFESSSKEFFSLEKGISLLNHNVGERKYYSDAYKETKQKIKFNKEELDRITNSRYFKSFYNNKVSYVKEKFS